MAKFKIDRSKLIATGIGEPSLYEVDVSNIEALEAACRAYREETKLPETMEDVRAKLRGMCKGNLYWLSGCDGGVESAQDFTLDEDDSNAFPALWQAEKLHALACMEQVWIALNPDGFDWVGKTGSSFICYNPHADTVGLDSSSAGFCHNPFPFRTRELAEQARRILTDEVIKTAFSVK